MKRSIRQTDRENKKKQVKQRGNICLRSETFFKMAGKEHDRKWADHYENLNRTKKQQKNNPFTKNPVQSQHNQYNQLFEEKKTSFLTEFGVNEAHLRAG